MYVSYDRNGSATGNYLRLRRVICNRRNKAAMLTPPRRRRIICNGAQNTMMLADAAPERLAAFLRPKYESGVRRIQ